jgi:hypothetical protein
MFSWKRVWLAIGAIVGIWIGVAGVLEGGREPFVAAVICGALGLICIWWLVASFTDTVPDLSPDGTGVIHVPLSRTSGVLANVGMLTLAFALAGGQMLSPDGAIATIVTGVLGLASAAFAAYAFTGLFSAVRGPAVIEIGPDDLRVRGGLQPWRAAWTDIEMVGVAPFAGQPALSIRFAEAAFTRQHPEGWASPPVQPNPCWLPTENTRAERDQLFGLVISAWKRAQTAAGGPA